MNNHPDPAVSYAAESRCWTCGTTVACTDGIAHPHTCDPDDTTRWQGYLDGWQDGYRYAAEHPADPMVQADRARYGAGWAGVMRTGALTIGCAPEEGP